MEDGRRKMEDKKGWYAIEAYQPFYAFSK